MQGTDNSFADRQIYRVVDLNILRPHNHIYKAFQKVLEWFQ